MKNSEIIKKYKSKKNIVYLTNYKCDNGDMIYAVYKRYNTSSENMKKEISIMKALKNRGLTVPKLYYDYEDFIIMEYIDGITLLDYVSELEVNQKVFFDEEKNKAFLRLFFGWMQDFYKLSKELSGKNYIMEDVNFRNFIIRDNVVYGLDFEDSGEGIKEKDGGSFCAFLLTYDPPYTVWKKKMSTLTIKILTEEFGYKKELLLREIERELERIKTRRGRKH